jgi:hypothetical protein
MSYYFDSMIIFLIRISYPIEQINCKYGYIYLQEYDCPLSDTTVIPLWDVHCLPGVLGTENMILKVNDWLCRGNTWG